MTEQGALRKARGARGVLDHDGIVGTDGRQCDALVVARRDERIPTVEADDLAQLGAVRRHRLHRLQHRVAAKTVDDEDAGRARLLQYILHFLGAKRRVDGDEHHARHAGAELEHHPFREVLRPDGNALARPKARQQRAGGALGFAIELRVGPLTAQLRIGDACNQGQPIGCRFSRPAQEVTERHLPYGRRRWACDVRLRQCHKVLPGPGTAPFLLPAFQSSPGSQNAFRRRSMQADWDVRGTLHATGDYFFCQTEEAGGKRWHADIQGRRRPTSGAQ